MTSWPWSGMIGVPALDHDPGVGPVVASAFSPPSTCRSLPESRRSGPCSADVRQVSIGRGRSERQIYHTAEIR